MKTAIYGNGIITEKLLSRASNYDYLIATDISSLKLVKNKIIPDLAIGDFDSVSRKDFLFLKKKIPNIKKFPMIKDFTDLELAVKHAIDLNPQSLDLYGVTGTRLDHVLAAIQILDVINTAKISGKIIDPNNEIIFTDNQVSIKKDKNFTFLSIIPFDQPATVSIIGCRYDLNQRKIVPGQTIGISNEIILKECQITVHRGKIILIRSKD